jgi:hypothetical protein
MFRWYKDAKVCYAYLSDVLVEDGSPSATNSSFRKSKWFTRGWTLQELLAPETVIFFDREWIEIGTKSSLEAAISSITGIEHLSGFEKACVAQKMSWASRRETLRTEDMAYCLLGLFGVNMPLLYGEGDKAFIRLQMEIMRVSDDESIFAWTDETLRNSRSGLLARSPIAFKDSGDIQLYRNERSAPYSMTNKGLQINLAATPFSATPFSEVAAWGGRRFHSAASKENYDTTYLAPIYCIRRGDYDFVALKLLRPSKFTDEYSRISCDKLLSVKDMKTAPRVQRTIFIRQEQSNPPASKKPILVSIYGAMYGGKEKMVYLSSSLFYPGRFDSNIFHLPKWTAASEAPKRLVKAADGRNMVRLELDTGIVVISCRAEEVFFGLEIDNPPHSAPTIDILLPTGGLSLKDVINTRLKPPIKRVTQNRVKGVLSSGALVSVSSTKSVELGQLLLTVEIEVTIDGPEKGSPSENKP